MGQDSGVLIKERMECEGRRPVGRPGRTWRKCTGQYIIREGLREAMAQDGMEWRSQ